MHFFHGREIQNNKPHPHGAAIEAAQSVPTKNAYQQQLTNSYIMYFRFAARCGNYDAMLGKLAYGGPTLSNVGRCGAHWLSLQHA